MPVSARAEPPSTPAALEAALLSSWPLGVDASDTKATRGTALVVGGSRFTSGAVLLSGLAALRMGAGRLQLVAADTVADHLSIAVPEAMVLPLGLCGSGALRLPSGDDPLIRHVGRAQSLAIGPGLVDEDEATALLELVLRATGAQTVVTIDALALRCLPALDPALLAGLRGRLILTPNDEELTALVSDDVDATDRVGRCAHVADLYGAVVTSFGVVAAPDGRLWAIGHSCPGLGTSGSGDVLAGLAAGAAARAGDPVRAACWATYVHTEAGLRLTRRCGPVSFLARELIDEATGVMCALERS
jgi:hydroxyethylthiazole kinase-like uncharacterized protein yjeF